MIDIKLSLQEYLTAQTVVQPSADTLVKCDLRLSKPLINSTKAYRLSFLGNQGKNAGVRLIY